MAAEEAYFCTYEALPGTHVLVPCAEVHPGELLLRCEVLPEPGALGLVLGVLGVGVLAWRRRWLTH